METATAGQRATTGDPAKTNGQVRGLVADASDLIEVDRGLIAFNLAYLGLAWIVAIGGIAIFWAAPAWYTFALAFVLVSSRQQALLNCEHECVHRKFVGSRKLNELLGTWLCAAPVGSPFAAAQARHLAHHRLLGMPQDPDHILHSSAPPKDSRLGLISYFVKGLLGGYAVMVLLGEKHETGRPEREAVKRDFAALAITQLVLFAGLTLAFSWWVYPALWLAPLATLTALSHLVRNFSEHAITGPETETNSNRLITIHSNPLERALLAPYYMNYHAEHH
ncbi:MAG: fatty acid desaturase, partial [Solirubrobacterales bacterium]